MKNPFIYKETLSRFPIRRIVEGEWPSYDIVIGSYEINQIKHIDYFTMPFKMIQTTIMTGSYERIKR